ncbi:hypothetical protein ACD591_00830 [Rufibacter glacialis]|uniref:Nucleotide-diphospho-sugar transferase domain-containing protein n=1 Tax=Rufibacter glacialis TaxID=1259555 RepID=A0A5M8QJW9_9BACT|nr:hypothetical protein [Rufibacter glacialis]KAA6435451.1 hypothetical protein FOE74_05740 [Rufibacter glacialis]GGK63553.1 hypothetical protein GCM10011405_09490 [Rufibacter glacialis]
MNLLLLTVGPHLNTYSQANFAILSFLPYLQPGQHTVYVCTDHPQYYQHLAQEVQLLPVTQEQLTQWQGPHRFFWRIKIKAIEHLMSQAPDQPVVYVDSDVFLFQPPQAWWAQLQSGTAFMHQMEGQLSALKSKTEKKMWQQVQGMDFGAFQINSRHQMWNAGVVAVPAQQNLAAIALALRICDQMCAQQVTPRLIEQFALSVALQETYGLQEAKPWLAHYWGNKEEWNERIAQFFLAARLEGCTVAQEVVRLQLFDFTSLALVSRNKRTRARLLHVVDRLFPLKAQVFIEK